MPSAEYHRKQAELFAGLALANTSNVYLMERYTALAKEHLAMAADADDAKPTGQIPPAAARRDTSSDMDRD